MTAKSTIIEVLGAGDLLVSDAIARSLIANDQVKYMLALLQEARAHAEAPSVPAADLSRERILSRLDAPWLDDVVPQARKGPGGQLRLARGAELVGLMYETVATMLACLPERERAPLDKRLTELRSAGPDGGSLTGVAIDAITSGRPGASDDASGDLAVRRVSVEGERQARVAVDEGERTAGILERVEATVRLSHVRPTAPATSALSASYLIQSR